LELLVAARGSGERLGLPSLLPPILAGRSFLPPSRPFDPSSDYIFTARCGAVRVVSGVSFARNRDPRGSGSVLAHSSTRLCLRAMLNRAPLSIQDCILIVNLVVVL